MADTQSLTTPGTEAFRGGGEHFDMPNPRTPQKASHATDCPLRDMENEHADSVIYEAAHYGWKNRSAQSVLEAVAVCDHCRARFREHTTQHRQEVYAHVRGLAEKLGGMRQYHVALRSKKVWITEDIEAVLGDAPVLRPHSEVTGVWGSLFHAFVSLMREACDVRYPELPFVRLTAGLLPQDWQERDALEYIATEADLGNRGITAGLAELERLIREHSDKAIEPLGWFVPDDNGQLCLIGWEGLLEPQYGDVGTRTYMKENTTSTANSLTEENAELLDEIQNEARVENAPI